LESPLIFELEVGKFLSFEWVGEIPANPDGLPTKLKQIENSLQYA